MKDDIDKKIMATIFMILFMMIWVAVIAMAIESQIAMMVVGGTIPLATIIVQYYWRKAPSERR